MLINEKKTGIPVSFVIYTRATQPTVRIFLWCLARIPAADVQKPRKYFDRGLCSQLNGLSRDFTAQTLGCSCFPTVRDPAQVLTPLLRVKGPQSSGFTTHTLCLGLVRNSA